MGVIEQQLALGGEVQLLAFADEELDAEISLELANPRRYVGLHAVELLRGTRDPTGPHHRAEDAQIGQILGLSPSFSQRD